MAQRVSLGLALGLVAACAVAGAASHAAACSGLDCFPSTYFPREGTVPANLPGIYFWPGHSYSQDAGHELDTSSLRLARVDGDEPVLIDFTLEPIAPGLDDREGFLIVPSAPFVAGASYVAWDSGCNPGHASDVPPDEPDSDPIAEEGNPYPFLRGFEFFAARFSVSEAAPMPTELGALTAETQVDEFPMHLPGGSLCSIQTEVPARELELTLHSSALPWKDALFYVTEVDGEEYEPNGGYQLDPAPGTALVGRGKDVVYTLCDDESEAQSDGVVPGHHDALVRGHVPGSSTTLSTTQVSCGLECPFREVGDGGLRDAGPVMPVDDASVPYADAAVRDRDAEVDEGDGALPDRHVPIDHDESEDDGCSAVGRAGSSSLAWLAFVLVALALRRRA
jgi:uncharacterized protein (TIGR03382 family)